MAMYVEQYCPHILLVREVVQYWGVACWGQRLPFQHVAHTYISTWLGYQLILSAIHARHCSSIHIALWSPCEPLRNGGAQGPPLAQGLKGLSLSHPSLEVTFFTTSHKQIKTGYLHYIRITPFYFPYSVRGWPQPLVFPKKHYLHIFELFTDINY